MGEVGQVSWELQRLPGSYHSWGGPSSLKEPRTILRSVLSNSMLPVLPVFIIFPLDGDIGDGLQKC